MKRLFIALLSLAALTDTASNTNKAINKRPISIKILKSQIINDKPYHLL